MASKQESKSLKPLEPISENIDGVGLDFSGCSDEVLKDMIEGNIDVKELIKSELEKRNQ